MFEGINVAPVQLLPFLAMVQSLSVIVFLSFRTQSLQDILPCLTYFLVFFGATSLDFFKPYFEDHGSEFQIISWAFWLSLIPLSCLILFQISSPPNRRWGILLLSLTVLFLLFIIIFQVFSASSCGEGICLALKSVKLGGLIIASFSLLAVILRYDVFRSLNDNKGGKTKYALTLSLVFINTMFLFLTMISLLNMLGPKDVFFIKNILGLGTIYIVVSFLFHILPTSLSLSEKPRFLIKTYSKNEEAILQQIQNAIEIDKVYQEPNFGRAELAREVHANEAMISKLVNNHYGQTVPQLLNHLRLREAEGLLKQTREPVNIVALESGFASTATFNRVFRQAHHKSPSAYRKQFYKKRG